MELEERKKGDVDKGARDRWWALTSEGELRYYPALQAILQGCLQIKYHH